MSTVRQFIWERLFESTNDILGVVKLNNYTLVQYTTQSARGPTLVGLCHHWKVRLQPFSRLHVASQFLSQEATMSTITVSQRETQTGHQIGHCSMPRRCPRGARWHQGWRCCVRRTSHLVGAEACSRRHFLRIIMLCLRCVPTIMCNINRVKVT